MLNTLRALASLGIAALLIAACAQAPETAGGSTIEVQDPWARAASAMAMDMEQDADAMDEGEGDSDMADMGEGEGDGDMADMGEGDGDMAGMGHGDGATSAIYMTLVNSSDQADALVSAATDVAATVELHLSSMEDGIMRMRPVERIDVPANGQAELVPGGYHVMLIGLQQDLNEGDTINVTLTFERSDPVELQVPVRQLQQ